jgi:hypothetical protein
MVALFAIALVVILSIAITVGAGHGFDQVTLALPLFFVLLFLTIRVGDRLGIEDFFIAPKPLVSIALTRGPPA